MLKSDTAGRRVDEAVVPSVERGDDVRFERHALLVFPSYVLTKLVADELVQIGLRDEDISHHLREAVARD